MARLGTGDHSRGKIDTYSAGRFEPGKKISPATAQLEHALARRHQELIYARNLIVIVVAKSPTFIAIPITDSLLAVIKCLLQARVTVNHCNSQIAVRSSNLIRAMAYF